ncbi:MAG: hypothetical protein ABI596_14935 [Pyrinomonadaceae bacterium]
MPSPTEKKIHGRRRLIPVLAVVGLLALLLLGGLIYRIRHRPQPPKPDQTSQLEQDSQLPPFATKEPQRYQATRITTSTSGSVADASQPASDRVFIARDGDRRREDYDLNGVVVSYLELSSARYALLPAQRIYVDLEGEPEAEVPAELASEFSAERLLNQSPSESRYEVLGNEVLNGRATARYRVTIGNLAEGNSVKAETLIWVDQLLGMPIKSETTVTEDNNVSKFTTELQSISDAVEPTLFALPQDFKKVSYKEFERQMKAATRPR